MKPGRELDALVAGHVMGWSIEYIDSNVAVGIPPLGDGQEQAIPSYSADIAAVWEVVEKIKEKSPMIFNYGFKIHYWNGRWYAYYEHEDYFGTWKAPYGEGDTAPHAICLAALKALGVEL